MYALTHCRIYTGYQILDEHTIIIKDDKVSTIVKQDELTIDIPQKNLQGAIVAPGFIDIQINGCGGVQFNETLDALSVKTLESMAATNLVYGCTSFLPTLITSSEAFMQKAINVMDEYLRSYKNQALGLHLEGPYINPIKKGIHNEEFIRQPNATEIDFLCRHADTIKVITLAPEKVKPEFIKQLTDAGIHISVGHSNATYSECYSGFDAGIRLGTHLFNAMPPILGREPGIVGAIYDAPNVYAGIIADGEHVSWANIRNSHNIKQDHLILITDAMLLAGTNLTSAVFAGKTIYYQNGRCVDENGVLGGSALNMITAVKNAVHHVGIALDEALRMASLYPATAIGVDDRLGSISQGKIANLVVFDDQFNIKQTIVNGKLTL